jgi:hypothetical protein
MAGDEVISEPSPSGMLRRTAFGWTFAGRLHIANAATASDPMAIAADAQTGERWARRASVEAVARGAAVSKAPSSARRIDAMSGTRCFGSLCKERCR